jgi:hypothetical protein
MRQKDKYKILFTKLEEAIVEQKDKYNLHYDTYPQQDESIKELIEICNMLEEEAPKEEYNSFTIS